MIYGCSPAAVKIPSCTDSSSVNGNAGTYFATGSNLSGDDEFSDDDFETNQHNKSENDDNFSILITSQGNWKFRCQQNKEKIWQHHSKVNR